MRGIESFSTSFQSHREGDDRRHFFVHGLDNRLYYISVQREISEFLWLRQHGQLQSPVVRQLLMDCLRYWVADMHVDGLRFDLASVMGRNEFGEVMVEPPIVESIAKDGVLADTKLIAEPWDAGGLYQVGQFPFGRRWSEWNGRYRDDVRRFWRGEPGFAGALATRICGSSDLYQASGRLPKHSVNFITCHDGFTLLDLVSYNVRKAAKANGEEKTARDGGRAAAIAESKDRRRTQPFSKIPPTPDQEPPMATLCSIARRADAAWRAMNSAATSARQQRLVSGQRNWLDRPGA